LDKYNVYKHPILGYEAIKQGFSWPGFLFTWIWAFVKKLWVIGIVLLVAAFFANSIGFALSGEGASGAFLGLIVSLIPMFIAGAIGNEWRQESMHTRGYNLECTVMAASPEGALAEAMKPAEERDQHNLTTINNQPYGSKPGSFICEMCNSPLRINWGNGQVKLCEKCSSTEQGNLLMANKHVALPP
jgi:hypothetical protein